MAYHQFAFGTVLYVLFECRNTLLVFQCYNKTQIFRLIKTKNVYVNLLRKVINKFKYDNANIRVNIII